MQRWRKSAGAPDAHGPTIASPRVYRLPPQPSESQPCEVSADTQAATDHRSPSIHTLHLNWTISVRSRVRAGARPAHPRRPIIRRLLRRRGGRAKRTTASAQPAPKANNSAVESVTVQPTMSHLTPQQATPTSPFSLSDDSDLDLPVTTARSSPMPLSSTPPLASSSSVPYRDSVEAAASPIFDYDPEATDVPKYDESGSYYPPQPIKSGVSSREAQFELDGDDVSEDEEPLLMEGLIATARARASGELPIAERVRKSLEGVGDRPAWLDKGAGVLSGIANMSNSILGAGIIGKHQRGS